MKHLLFTFLLTTVAIPTAQAEERTLIPEQMEALANSSDFTEDQEAERPKNLPDLTKGGGNG